MQINILKLKKTQKKRKKKPKKYAENMLKNAEYANQYKTNVISRQYDRCQQKYAKDVIKYEKYAKYEIL